jgi:hypothetical protein
VSKAVFDKAEVRQAARLYQRWSDFKAHAAKVTQWPGQIKGTFVLLGRLDALQLVQGHRTVRYDGIHAPLYCRAEGTHLLARLDGSGLDGGKLPVTGDPSRWPPTGDDHWFGLGTVSLVEYTSTKWDRRAKRFRHEVTGIARVFVHESETVLRITGLTVTARGIEG